MLMRTAVPACQSYANKGHLLLPSYGTAESMPSARVVRALHHQALTHQSLFKAHRRPKLTVTHAVDTFVESVHAGSPLLGDMIAKPHETLGIALPLWLKLAGLVVANILGVQAVQSVMRGVGDSSEPLSVVKVQVGLLKDHNELQHRLSELSGMIQLGQQGIWLVLEESILEISQHRGACAYACVSVTHLKSKNEAYQLFGRMAETNRGKAQEEEQLVHDGMAGLDAASRGTTAMSTTEQPGTAQRQPVGIIDRLMGRRGAKGDEAMVITLLVTCRGNLDVPTRMESWQDVQHSLQQLGGLSSSSLMAIELLWTPHDEGTFMTPQQMVQDYQELKPIR